jgi:hypothetical protein
MSMRHKISDIQMQVSEMRSLMAAADLSIDGIGVQIDSDEQDALTNLQNLFRLAIRHARDLDGMVDVLSADMHGGRDHGQN